MRLVTGVHVLRVTAEQLPRVGAVRVGGPDAVKMRGRPVHVVPPDIRDLPVRQHLRMPLARLVERERAHIPPVRFHPVQGMRGKGLPGVVATGESAPHGRHERNPPVRQGTGIEIIVGAVGQLPQVAAAGIHRVNVEAPPVGRIEVRFLLGAGREGEIDGLRVVRQRQGRVVSPRERAAQKIRDPLRCARLFEHINAPALDVAVIIIIAEIFVQHLADEPPPFHEEDAFPRDERVRQRQVPRKPADVVIACPALRFGAPVEVPPRAEPRQGLRRLLALRRAGHGRQRRMQTLRTRQRVGYGPGISRIPAQPCLLPRPVRLDFLAEPGVIAPRDGG